MTDSEKYVQSHLFEMQEPRYREFQCGLMPTVDPSTVIGVRTPALRKFAREFFADPRSAEFITVLPHRFYEENNLHAFLLEQIKDFDSVIAALDAFLPYVDNWATCDSMSPVVLGRHLPELYEKIKEWLNAQNAYTVRFGIGMLMRFYLDDNFKEEYADAVAALRSDEYYVNMMRAWYFATALAKQYDKAIRYLTNRRLDAPTHNKTIRKAIESYRIDDEKKAFLRTLKTS